MYKRQEYHFIDVADTEEERFDRAAVEARFVAERIRRMLDEGYAVSGGDGLRRCTPCLLYTSRCV